MVVIYTSTTTPVNPPTTAPSEILTPAEFWKALEYKCRNPVQFVKPIQSSRIVKEERDHRTGQVTSVTRLVRAEGSEDEIEEIGRFKRPVMISFEIPSTGTLITNILSHGPHSKKKPEEIYMVSTYEWNHPEIEEGSSVHRQLEEKYRLMGSEIVPHTVALVRKMKVDGVLAEL